MFRHRIPHLFPILFPNFLWRSDPHNNAIYLTFDDGPHPRITEDVCDLLKGYNAKATFFCVGDNVQKYPETLKMILELGHSVGNHTYHHLNGWKTHTETYINDIQKCASLLSSTLFRPPYGRITPKQYQLLKLKYKVVMWDILTRDYDPNLNVKHALKTCTNNMKPGSILVFHDSEKAQKNLLTMLPHILEYGKQNGFTFQSLANR
jgi:peptidoglycan/xylan/chitin deacetylase (PgdA/CDA1 family)